MNDQALAGALAWFGLAAAVWAHHGARRITGRAGTRQARHANGATR